MELTYSLLIGIIAAAVVLTDPGGHLEVFENKTIDARQRFFSRPSRHTGDIIILDISENAIRRLEPIYGRWPWPRSLHGEVVEFLSRQGARSVGFDLIFSEKTRRQELDERHLESLKAMALNADLPEIKAEMVRQFESLRPGLHDDALVDSVRSSGRVFQASVVYGDKIRTDEIAEAQNPAPGSLPLDRNSLIPFSSGKVKNFLHVTAPFAALGAASAGTGYINVFPDRDGTCRSYLPVVSLDAGRYLHVSFPVVIAAKALGVDLSSARISNDGFTAGKLKIPLRRDGSAMIHYQGGRLERKNGAETYSPYYQYVPFENVIASIDRLGQGLPSLFPADYFRNKIVLITATAAGLSDLRNTPFSPVTPGVEIHANIIDSILSGEHLNFLEGPLEWAYVLMLVIMSAIVSLYVSTRRGWTLFAAAFLLLPLFHWYGAGANWVLPLIKPSLGILFSFTGVFVIRYLMEFREKSQIRSAFGHYLAPQVLGSVMKNPDLIRRGGVKKHVTVMFADIQGFTSLSEHLEPDDTAATLNEFMDLMTDCVLRYDGTLDKFIGDAVMAEWNIPAEQPGHASLACDAALDMLASLSRLKMLWKGKPQESLDMRIGINTGEMVAGNMGSHRIFDYTVVGLEVNSASRIESINRDFGTRIAVSAATAAEAELNSPGRFEFRFIARVLLKGRTSTLDVYELMGLKEEIPAERRELLELFNVGTEKFLAGDTAAAKEIFSRCLLLDPSDGPSDFYMRQCGTEESGRKDGSVKDAVYIQKDK